MEDLIIGSIPLLVAIVASFFIYKQPEAGWLRLFSLFLIFTFIVQFAGYYYSKTSQKSNHFIFNAYTLIEYLFYFFLFYHTNELKKYKKFVVITVIVFIIVFIFKISIWGSFWVYNPLVNNVGELFTLCFCGMYFFQLLNSNKWINYFSLPMFWITTAIAFAIVADFVYLSFFNYIMNNKIGPNGLIYGIITTTSTTVECGIFTVAFICKKVWTKTI